MPGYAKPIVPKAHVCNPPFTTQDDKRWRCGACHKQYWYNKANKRWELLIAS